MRGGLCGLICAWFSIGNVHIHTYITYIIHTQTRTQTDTDTSTHRSRDRHRKGAGTQTERGRESGLGTVFVGGGAERMNGEKKKYQKTKKPKNLKI